MAAIIKTLKQGASFCGVVNKVLQNAGGPISCDEIVTHVLELWGRELPQNPYEDVCFVYVFIKNYVDAEEIADEPCCEHIMVERLDGHKVALAPDLLPVELNSVSDRIKRIKFKAMQ